MSWRQATEVPVGEDNLQNIQIAQHLAAKFNSTFRPFFPRPRVGVMIPKLVLIELLNVSRYFPTLTGNYSIYVKKQFP
jgi:hypothetical protein